MISLNLAWAGIQKVKSLKCTGIILAGGKSSRLGKEKGLLLYKGMTLAQHAIKVLTTFCERIIIVTANPAYSQQDVSLVSDLVPGKGPLMGLYSGLQSSTTQHNLVIAVDNCFVGPEYFEYVLPQVPGYEVAVPFINQQYYEPLVGYYSRDVIPAMKLYIERGYYNPPGLLDIVKVKKLRVEEDFKDYHPGYFKSINLPEDLQLIQEFP